MDHNLEKLKEHKIIGRLVDWKRLEDILNNHDITLLDILGKGHRGVVFKGVYNNREVAIKVPRVDAKNTIYQEGCILKEVNALNIGPKLYTFSRDFLIMEYIEGITLKNYISRGDINKEEYLNIVKEVLKQCVRLDIHGIDHGEIQGGKHIVISGSPIKVYIIDFGSAKIGRTPRNFTSAVSLFFGKSYIANRTCEILGVTEIELERIREFVRNYKRYIVKK
ncbi:serine/threonine protein kinase [Methanofervidicoccus sp. A16]|uniref:protein kinase domain-containing protein n=1 Tax=Methanofervidicoccus sp. A16 TaxID=2607662 RepID=UPI00118A3847|nr:protein kinase [Methanofervidicoccus sp. A16]AXI25559.1 serine/threonine protein kinase [Methanofervidicoccus sp. A16]